MDIAREVLAILVVFGLLGALLFFGRRAQWVATGLRRPPAGIRRLEIVETIRIGPHQSLHIVRVDRRMLVISSHPSGCTLLRDMEATEI